MPIYEIECENCQTIKEIKRGIAEGAPTACLDCGGDVHQVYSPPAIFMGKMPLSGHRKWVSPGSDGEKP